MNPDEIKAYLKSAGGPFELARRAKEVKAHQARMAGPEGEIARQRERLLAEGQQTRAEGLSVIRTFDPNDFLGPDALRSVFDQATTTNFVPQLRALQARNARRNIRGPLAGATEGDLAAGFRRDILAEVGRSGAERARLAFGRGREIAEIGGFDRAQGLELLGTEAELAIAREEAAKEERARRRRGIGAFLGTAAGAAIGSVVPGVGTTIGASIGSRLGAGLSN